MTQRVRGVISGPRASRSNSSTSSSRPRPGRGGRRRAGLRCLPHRPHLPRGGINDDYPFLLGHGAAGVVEAVGEGVTAVAPGDFVILNWRAVCGQCRACKRGRPWYCFATFNAEQKMTLTDGTELTPPWASARSPTRPWFAGAVHQSRSGSRPAVAGLLGCGVMAGIGAAINTGAITRDDTVAVIGCGGVGDAAIAGANLVGARQIIAVDTDDTKLHWAREFGATHTINARELGVVETIRDLTGGDGADVVIDAVGRPETWKQAFYARDLAGTVVLVGVPTPEMTLDMPLVDFFSRGGSLKSSWYGDCLPERDFPTLIALYRQGRLPLEKFVSERIGLEGRGRLRQDARRTGAALGGRVVSAGGIQRWSPRQFRPRRRQLGRSTTTCGSSATTRSDRHRRRPRREGHRGRGGRSPRRRGGLHPRPQRPHHRRPTN